MESAASPVAMALPLFSDPGAVRAAEEESLERALGPWRTRYPAVDVHTEVVEGRPVPALVEAAKEARLVVVGASGRHGLPRFALGSTAHSMLHRSPCPVTVAHTR
ncbi:MULTISPECIES: universal stress protein [unclassified Nocardiopsis]|uniref:universal stress protein n=1 Tax=unclassified Nocardiopsis TaxID=2649073 RepID=UPI001F5B542E|nr:universal stress protein [Nocardiopsis sp. TSRI0078]